MYRLLVVDDEKNIRLGIQTMIQREFTIFEVEVASDGQEAIEIMDQQTIDILITDIKMPRMDGIYLIRTIQQMRQKPALIILSGYDDFEYAKTAIQCNVKDYILKPVNRHELFQTLRRVVEERESSHVISEEYFDEYRSSQFNYLLLNPNITEEEIEKQCRKLKMNEFSQGYYVGILENREEIKGKDCLKRIKQMIEQGYGNDGSEYIYFCDKDENTVLISPGLEVFHYLNDKMAAEKYFRCSLSVSAKQVELKKIKEGYQQAAQTKKYHFLFPKSFLIFYEDVKNNPNTKEVPISTINKIANMIGTERDQEIESCLLELFDYELITKKPIQYIELLSEQINTQIFDHYFQKIGEESIRIFNIYNRVGDLYSFNDIYEYYSAVENLVMRLHEYVKQIKMVYAEQKYMEKAICYMERNFHKDLNLAVVSNYISLNYSYFSHAFKEYTGYNFVDYLKQVRIREAKKLLIETDDKISEVSQLVGYKNPKQFARVFREIEGITPKEFREQSYHREEPRQPIYDSNK